MNRLHERDSPGNCSATLPIDYSCKFRPSYEAGEYSLPSDIDASVRSSVELSAQLAVSMLPQIP